ncbi:MAG: dephospho-CoA kinase [Acidimicrobiales bacterium]
MKLIGLTGGIGAGKSSVAALLAERGAVVVDADAITRDLQRPGQPVFDAIVERFGTGVVAADGTLHRPALASVVFADAAALADLNRLVHPAVGVAIAEVIAAHAGTDAVVVLDVPLLVESADLGPEVSGLLVVDCPVEVAVERLVTQRGMDEADARARIARQAPRDERLSRADHVIDNSGPPEALPALVDHAWTWIEGLPDA